MSSFQLKLDTASLPKLSSRGDNYTEWRGAWTIALRYAEVWEYVSGKKTKPSPNANADSIESWDKSNNKALVMLMQAVHTEITIMVSSQDTAAEAWKALSDRFDRDTGSSTIHLFRAITNLRHQDGNDLRTHLDDFHQLWIKLQRRCAGSKQPVAKAMNAIFTNDDVKGSFFLTTLPDTMDNIVDNLATKDITSFIDIEPKILDVAEKHTLTGAESSAYYTATARKPTNKSTPPIRNTSGNPATRTNVTTGTPECTWCKKHNLTFIGHVYTNCNKLREHNDLRKASTTTTTTTTPLRNAKRKPPGARLAVHEDENTIQGNAFTAHSNVDDTDTDEVQITCVKKRRGNTQAFAVQLPSNTIYPPSSSWLFDSGASRHMSGIITDFVSLSPQTGTITTAGERKIPIHGVGTVRLMCLLPDGSNEMCTLTNVLYSQELHHTRLFSWPYIRNKGFSVTAMKNDLYLTKPDGSIALWAVHAGGSMVIQLDDLGQPTTHFASYREFHDALGHPAPSTMHNPERIYKDASGLPNVPDDFQCETCILSKSTHAVPKSIQRPHTTAPFQIIHSDLSGKFSVKSLGGSFYFMTFIDEHTRFTWIKFLARKAEALDVTKDFIAYVKTQHGTTIRKIHTDNGGEYVSNDLRKHFRSQGIEFQCSPSYHHESNGLAERYNRTVVTIARAMIQSDKQLHLWAEAIKTACYLKNIKPHAALPTKMTPYEAMFGNKPRIMHLHPFGSLCYAHIHKEARAPGTKLLHRAEPAVFVGYGQSTSIMRVYVPNRNTVFETKDVKFALYQAATRSDIFEIDTVDSEAVRKSSVSTGTLSGIPPLVPSSPSSRPPTTPVKPSSPSRIPVATPPQPRSVSPTKKTTGGGDTGRPQRSVRPPTRFESGNVATDNEDAELQAFAFSTQSDENIPNTIQQAQRSTDWHHWKQAVQHELQSHKDNGTWEKVAHGAEIRNVVGSRWVFGIKYDHNGDISKYKARLVAQGFSQVHGVDYDETYSPVARYDSLRILFRIATVYGLDMHQMDFDTAYLNSTLNETIHMRMPPGYLESGYVLRLKKALYGLKQSGREWFGTLHKWLTEREFKSTHFDPCVFRKDQFYVAVYVDDLLLVGHDVDMIAFKTALTSAFKCKDLGRSKYLLGLEVVHTPTYVGITQRAYAERILQRFDMMDCNPRQTPLDPGCFPAKSTASDEIADIKIYQQMMGSLMYLVIGTRPDLAFAVTMLSTFNANPNPVHMSHIKQVLRYLKGTTEYALKFPKSPQMQACGSLPQLQLQMYADASWGTDPENSRSFSGFILQINDATVSWSAKRQKTVAKSTCEAEYMACSYAAGHLLWASSSMSELKCAATATLFTDNAAAEALIRNPRITARSKHIAIHYHFVRERHGVDFKIDHVASADNLADICTKSLPRPLMTLLTDRIMG